ncbi:hypothetical protein H2203_005067 [Taxawa tesnikishii (nom. ined.)]|nr:hypothetical protein H2203_005067 [Dothideales sp. JES 119]
MSGIEAVYIFNEHNNAVLTHTFAARPPSASIVLPLYLAHASPRPSCLYLSNTNPPSLLFSIIQDRLLFLCPCSADVEPLLALEFLHRVADALEEFLGAPLLASKIESSYDVVAQVLGEMCDAGLVGGTEANALRDVVETPTWVGKLLGGVGLPGTPPTLNPSQGGLGISKPTLQPTLSTSGSAIPWRRSNVRHTSNELYVDIVETLSVTYTPSGRPLSAFANGSIAFTSKVSGVPDLLLTLSTGSGGGQQRGEKVRRTMERPAFHPCVRLARWREHGELSFVPPDGRFVLAGYEVDLLDPSAPPLSAKPSDLNLPAAIDVRTGLGPAGNEFEVRLSVSHRFASGGGSGAGAGSAAASLSSHLGRPGAAKGPVLESVTVSIPIVAGVRSISEMRPSKGEAHWSPGDAAVEWTVGAKDAASIGGAGAVLRCALVGAADEDEEGLMGGMNGVKADTYDYDEDAPSAYQSADAGREKERERERERSDRKAVTQNAQLMPTSATLGFSVKGWLASGLKVDSLVVDVRKSKGLGEGVRPYKGVKYLTVSRGGIEHMKRDETKQAPAMHLRSKFDHT